MNIVILAAGKGNRMCSDIPKVLHSIAGKPIIKYIVDTAKNINKHKIYIIYGFKGDLIKKKLNDNSIHWILQKEQLGTGHAIQQLLPYLNNNENLLILYGDIPFISKATLEQLCDKKPKHGMSLLTAILDNPSGYGRVIRNNNVIAEIIEDKDANSHQLNIKEINTGIMFANVKDVKNWLKRTNNDNVQKEYYLTDIIKIAYQDNYFIKAIHPFDINEIKGVNDRIQLANLERIYQSNQIKTLILSGVTLRDPDRFDLRGTLICGIDVEIDVNVIIEGHVVLGNRVKIGAGCIIQNSSIDDDCNIHPYSIIRNSNLSVKCNIGPFSHLRNNAKLNHNVCIGNFVEIKDISLGNNSKAKHLSYLGDSEIGSNVNIGAGSITCNYDGKNKLKTIIGNDVFIGSDTQLVAPLTIIDNATIAAGTTVLKDINTSDLTLNPKKQIYKENWKRPSKK
nr:bifunctional UDP-N-acetylglucosamine diphosphorylase/glucosamine-1-phosphate N-acetyltransferase GlmU [Candidatus Pantoea edessiphila]